MSEDRPIYHIPEVRCYRLREIMAGLARLEDQRDIGDEVRVQIGYLQKLVSSHWNECAICKSNMLQDQLFSWGQVRIIDPEDQ